MFVLEWSKSLKNCSKSTHSTLKRKYSKSKLLPSCPELSRCSIKSQPNALSLPFFLDFCLIPLFFMWLQLVIQIIIVKGSLEAQGSIHMSQKHKIEIIPWKKIKENKKAGAQKSQQSAPKCLHPLTFWPSTLEEAEGRSDVTLSTLSPWKCHFFTGRQRRGRRSTAAWLDVPVGFFISEGFAGAALESDGFLLSFFCVFFYPQSASHCFFYLLLFSVIPQSPVLTRSSCPRPQDHRLIWTLHVCDM